MTDAKVYPTYLRRIDRFKLGLAQSAVDAGYNTLQNLLLLSKRQIQAIASRRHPSPKGMMGKWRFR